MRDWGRVSCGIWQSIRKSESEIRGDVLRVNPPHGEAKEIKDATDVCTGGKTSWSCES